MDYASEDRSDAVIRARDELNSGQRARFWPAEATGDVVVAIGVPLVLWNDVSHWLLVGWGVLVVLAAFFLEASVGFRAHRQPTRPALLTFFEWHSAVIWGALPWIRWSALDDGGVQWLLVAVVIFGIAGDTIFVNQTSAVSVD